MRRKKKEPDAGDTKQREQDLNAGPEPAEPDSSTNALPDIEEADARYLRLRADFDNFRKRVLREREETSRKAQDELLKELLPVLDHIELGLKAGAEDDPNGAFLDSYRMLSDQLAGVLVKFGLEPVRAVGIQDPNLHEAVSHVPSDAPPGTIIHEVRKGYKAGKRLLRAAQVVVASMDEDRTEEDSQEERPDAGEDEVAPAAEADREFPEQVAELRKE